MRKFFAIFLIMVFVSSVFLPLVSGAMDIYTFKKDRVDQKVDGNQGYIMGNPPPAEDRTGIKRTLIGVDIELYSGGTEQSEEAEPVKAKKPAPAPPKAKPKAPKKVETVVVEEETQEEEWIK